MKTAIFRTARPVRAGLLAGALLAAALLAAAPARAGGLDAMLAGGGELYSIDRDGAWRLSDKWELAPDGSLGGIRTAERSASRGVTIFVYTRLVGRWWIADGDLCLDDNVSGQHCYRVSPGGGGGRDGGARPDRYTGVETGSGRAVPLFIFPRERS